MVTVMIEVTSRQMECTLLTPDFSQMPAVALQPLLRKAENSLSDMSETEGPLFFKRGLKQPPPLPCTKSTYATAHFEIVLLERNKNVTYQRSKNKR